ncbi:MAG TPA: YhbY family RNA-binding protein [Euryarchaeota archaeon]|nr:MAG: ribosome assembly RNA-binding protein YhbY [Thermococci archaeon]RLF97276.1 MAG: ribosome assembly RNA-binding protein YhbY [Thermococci archaeon]HDI10220.1 YhbY family RNA-binding protein [Euryarchaeota archaeon]
MQEEKRLPGKIRRRMRSMGIDISPAVNIGKRGIDAAMGEIDRQLKDLGLVKVKFLKSVVGERKELAREVAMRLDAELIEVRGRTFLLFRPREGWSKYLRKLRRGTGGGSNN